MEKRSSILSQFKQDNAKKIYVVLIGSAPMASLDALMLSLERFKNILSSDSARDRFETTLRTIKSSIREVSQFIDDVYLEKNPNRSVNMKGYTLILELTLTKEEFLEYVDNGKVEEIVTQIISVGTMPAKKMAGQQTREYKAYPVRYAQGRFVKDIR